MPLFRAQALEEQSGRLQGEVIVLPKISHSLVCWSIGVWLAAGLLLVTQLSYARKETVLGWLEPADGVVRVYAETEGKLARLLVEEGTAVVEGQPLAIINGDRILTDGQHLEDVLLKQYEDQKRSLERQLARAEVIAGQRLNDLQQQLHASAEELDWIDDQLGTVRKRQSLLMKRIEIHEGLAGNGHVSELELDTLRDQQLGLMSESQTLSRDRVRHADAISQLLAQQRLLPQQVADQTDGFRFRLIDISREIARLRGQRAYVIKASRAGVIANLQIQEGQRARFNVPLMLVVSDEQALQAHLLVPVRASGFVEVGQSVNIRYDAYPHQKFGAYAATVTGISETVNLPGEFANSPIDMREPVYRVSANLVSGQVEAYGLPVGLKTGMTLQADIRLDDRTLLQWLLDPILSLKGRL